MNKTNLKLYIWTGYYPVYTGGLAFAIAESEEAARKLIDDKRGHTIRDFEWGDLEIRPLNEPVAYELCGSA